MSDFIVNKSCEMCRKIETGLVEMSVGKTKHSLCYDCMAIFALDIMEFAAHNLKNEFSRYGRAINFTNDGGIVVSDRKEN